MSQNLLPRLQDKSGICTYLGGITSATYDRWQRRGIVPGPISGTNRYDLRAHDLALDRLSGAAVPATQTPAQLDPLDEWLDAHAN